MVFSMPPVMDEEEEEGRGFVVDLEPTLDFDGGEEDGDVAEAEAAPLRMVAVDLEEGVTMTERRIGSYWFVGLFVGLLVVVVVVVVEEKRVWGVGCDSDKL